ncbi:hypothetical protein [Sinorhizobium medicae]|uniref:hypothetical protein n=1 Tax=Sinorhizobium medicae TaxID=110321 RepID=UPI002B1BDB9C|nr:hypothetical protein [Sinorhizobium medicae]WQO45906.1 hypothetical protein U8C42_02450 [Sinorhizobium medicae]
MPEDDEFVRPQDDPRHREAVEAAIAAYRAEHPPVNCWVETPYHLDLYLGGRRWAHVAIEDAEVTLFDETGDVVSTFPYLQSESAYEVVERRLGVGRIEEVRDESDEGGGAPDPSLRRLEEQEARDFREQHGGSGEALYYLRQAVSGLEKFSVSLPENEKESLALLCDAATALEAGEPRAARVMVARALSLPEDKSFSWGVARRHCVRALAVTERDIDAGL